MVIAVLFLVLPPIASLGQRLSPPDLQSPRRLSLQRHSTLCIGPLTTCQPVPSLLQRQP